MMWPSSRSLCPIAHTSVRPSPSTCTCGTTTTPRRFQVDLFKSVPGGFTQVGSLTQSVPVRPPGGNSTRFAFSYTISQSDKSVGKVTFRASATLIEHRDALPADNELTSPPVKIT